MRHNVFLNIASGGFWSSPCCAHHRDGAACAGRRDLAGHADAGRRRLQRHDRRHRLARAVLPRPVPALGARAAPVGDERGHGAAPRTGIEVQHDGRPVPGPGPAPGLPSGRLLTVVESSCLRPASAGWCAAPRAAARARCCARSPAVALQRGRISLPDERPHDVHAAEELPARGPLIEVLAYPATADQIATA